jgi:hypothetical protein
MARRGGCTVRPLLHIFFVSLAVLMAAVGCAYKPGYVRGPATDVANRWQVDQIEPTRLSKDQRDVFERRGPPTYVRFFREVETRKPVYAWIYAGENEAVDLVWFVDGQQVEAIAVDSDTSAFTSTTRRRARYALLIGTGAAILPAVVLLANQ